MSHTPPVDSKGAAIEKIEKLVYAIKNDGHLNGHATIEKPWVDQILAILAQEVKRARLSEFEKLQEFALKNNYDPEIIRGYVVGAILSIGEQLKTAPIERLG